MKLRPDRCVLACLPFPVKLALLTTLTSLTILAAVSVTFLFYERDSYRNEMIRDGNVLAQIISESTGHSILRGDRATADHILDAIRSEWHVLCVVLYDSDGRVFTSSHHGPEEDQAAEPGVEPPGSRFTEGALLTFETVEVGGHPVGTVMVRMGLEPLQARQRGLMGLVALTLVLALLATLVISIGVHRILSRPIRSLVETARKVSFEKDYSVRAPGGTKDELGTLSRAFNDMLDRIEERDRSLSDARGQLEAHLSDLEEQIRQKNEAQQALAQSEEQLRQAQKMEAIGILAGGVAHDFNNILTAILGYGQLLLRRLGPDSPHQDTVREIISAGDRASALTGQLLAFSRRQILEPKVLDLNQVVRNMEKMLRRLIGEDIEFMTAFDPDLGKVEVDPGQIEQILLNLSVNSRDAMPHGGTLVIETKNTELNSYHSDEHVEVAPGPYVMVSVSDTGCGMDAEMRRRIFEPFFTTKAQGKGTGLGLSTVFGIVKQSGGHISVSSKPGQGTTFKFYLPRVDGDAISDDRAAATAPIGASHELILLVEDQEQVRDVVAQMLESFGFEVLQAESGEAALGISTGEKRPIDLLLTDLVMPGMSGRELSDHLAELRPDTKCLFMSGYTDDVVVRNRVLESGIPFIHKPFTADALHRAVRRALDEPRAAA